MSRACRHPPPLRHTASPHATPFPAGLPRRLSRPCAHMCPQEHGHAHPQVWARQLPGGNVQEGDSDHERCADQHRGVDHHPRDLAGYQVKVHLHGPRCACSAALAPRWSLEQLSSMQLLQCRGARVRKAAALTTLPCAYTVCTQDVAGSSFPALAAAVRPRRLPQRSKRCRRTAGFRSRCTRPTYRWLVQTPAPRRPRRCQQRRS